MIWDFPLFTHTHFHLPAPLNSISKKRRKVLYFILRQISRIPHGSNTYTWCCSVCFNLRKVLWTQITVRSSRSTNIRFPIEIVYLQIVVSYKSLCLSWQRAVDGAFPLCESYQTKKLKQRRLLCYLGGINKRHGLCLLAKDTMCTV